MKYELDRSIQREVQALLSWNARQWAQYVYDCGITYLQKLMPEYPQVAKQISSSRIFWNWWKYHWEQRDKEFIEQCYGWDEGVDTRIFLYKENNDPRTLVEAIYLNGQVLQESYAKMFGELSDEHTRKYREVAA